MTNISHLIYLVNCTVHKWAFLVFYFVFLLLYTIMNKRIVEIRRYLKFNQDIFAARLGLKRTALSMIESGKNILTEKNIKLICLTFNVNETWLRTGKGEMFGASPYEKEFFDIFKNLMPETQQALLRFAKELLRVQKKHYTTAKQ